MNEGAYDAAGNALRQPAYTIPVPRDEILRLVPAALRFYQRFADLLELSARDRRRLLGLVEGTDLPTAELATEEQFYRLSYLIGSWVDLGGLLGKEGAIHWLKTSRNTGGMAGRSAIIYMIDEGLPGFDYVRREVAYWADKG